MAGAIFASTVGSMGMPSCGATRPVTVPCGSPKLTVNGRPVVVTGILWGMHSRPKSHPHPEFSVQGSALLTVGGKPVTLDTMILSNGATARAIPCSLTVAG